MAETASPATNHLSAEDYAQILRVINDAVYGVVLPGGVWFLALWAASQIAAVFGGLFLYWALYVR